MSGTKEKPVEHDAPPVHVDTEEQAAARQLIETSQRVTHVAVVPEMPPPEEKEDFSLAVLVKPVVVVKKGDKPPGAAASHSDREKK